MTRKSFIISLGAALTAWMGFKPKKDEYTEILKPFFTTLHGKSGYMTMGGTFLFNGKNTQEWVDIVRLKHEYQESLKRGIGPFYDDNITCWTGKNYISVPREWIA